MEKAKETIINALRSRKERVRIAVQKDGRLRTLSLGILQSCVEALGTSLPDMPARKMRVWSEKIPQLEILFMRTSDMPGALKRKDVQFAFIGTDTLMEQGSRARIVEKLGEGKCSLQILVKKDARILNIRMLSDKNIATTFPRLLKRFLRRRFIYPKKIEQVKSVETSLDLPSFQAGCDIVQTGETMRINNLKSLATIAEFETVLATSL